MPGADQGVCRSCPPAALEPRTDNPGASSSPWSSRAGSGSSSSSSSSPHESFQATSTPAAHASSSSSSRPAQADSPPRPRSNRPTNPMLINFDVDFDALGIDVSTITLNPFATPAAPPSASPSSPTPFGGRRPAPTSQRKKIGDWSTFGVPVRRPPAEAKPQAQAAAPSSPRPLARAQSPPIAQAASPAVRGMREALSHMASRQPPAPVVVSSPPPTATRRQGARSTPASPHQLAAARPPRSAQAETASSTTSAAFTPTSPVATAPTASPSLSTSQAPADSAPAPPAAPSSPLASNPPRAASDAPLASYKPPSVDHIASASKALLDSLARTAQRASDAVAFPPSPAHSILPRATFATRPPSAAPSSTSRASAEPLAGPVATTTSSAPASGAGEHTYDLAYPTRGEAASFSLRAHVAAGRTAATSTAPTWSDQPATQPAPVARAGPGSPTEPVPSAAAPRAPPRPRAAAQAWKWPPAPLAASSSRTTQTQLSASAQQRDGIAYPHGFRPLVSSSSRSLPPIPLTADDLARESVRLPAPLQDLLLLFAQSTLPRWRLRNPGRPTSSAAWEDRAWFWMRTIDLDEVVPNSSLAREDPASVTREKEQRRETFTAWLVRGLNLISLAHSVSFPAPSVFRTHPAWLTRALAPPLSLPRLQSFGPAVLRVGERYLEVRFHKTLPRPEDHDGKLAGDLKLAGAFKRLVPAFDPLVEFASRYLAERATQDDLEPLGRRMEGKTELRVPTPTDTTTAPALASSSPASSSALRYPPTPAFAPHPVFYGSSASSPFEGLVRPSLKCADAAPVAPPPSSTPSRPAKRVPPPPRRPSSPAPSQISGLARPSSLPSLSLAGPAPPPRASLSWRKATPQTPPAPAQSPPAPAPHQPTPPPLYVETPWGVEIVRRGQSPPRVGESLGWVGWQQIRARGEDASA